MSTAIVLSGGASKGSFQVGALRYLRDHGITVQPGDLVVGVSVGAINAIKLAEGPLAATGDPVGELEAVWQNLHSNDDMFEEEPWLTALRDAIGQMVDTLILAYDPYFILPKLATGMFIVDWINIGLSANKLRKVRNKVKRARSLYNLAPVESALKQAVNQTSVRQSGIKLRLGVLELERGILRFVTESGRFLDAGPSSSPVNLIKAVLASAAIPSVFPDVSLLGRHYVDGGVREMVPIDMAVQEGASKVIAIVASESGLEPINALTLEHGEVRDHRLGVGCLPRHPDPPSPSADLDTPPLVKIGQRSIEVVADEVQVNDLFTRVSRNVAELRVIQPTLLVHSGMTINQGLIRINIDYGFMRASETMLGWNANRRWRSIAGPTSPRRFVRKTLETVLVAQRRSPAQRARILVAGKRPRGPINLADLAGLETENLPFVAAEYTPEALAAVLAGLSDEITCNRVRAYHAERYLRRRLRGRARGLEQYYRHAIAALPIIRDAKRRIHAGLQLRRTLQGEVPSYADDWWRSWEYHETPRELATPWDALYRQGRPVVPAEAPPT